MLQKIVSSLVQFPRALPYEVGNFDICLLNSLFSASNGSDNIKMVS